jgi:predicted enzyme related to lactoylglutathione lyase
MSYLPGKFVWFEHVSNDVGKASEFYSALCGWTVQSMPMGEQPYHMIMNGSDAIGGFRSGEPGMPSHWGSYLSVTDVDRSFAAATAAGANGLMPPVDFGNVGRAAVIADPTGAAVSLWKGAQGDPADVDKTLVGGWFWNELFSPDAAAAVAFYEKVFGFSHDAMDMGPQGTYYVLKDTAGKPRAGVMQQPSNMRVPAHWLPYVHVADCDAALAKATTLGARQTLVAPTDIPNVGRFAVLLDPLGAAIAVIKGV